MKDGKIIVARLWPRYNGRIPSRAPIVLGIDPQKYQTICIYLMKNSQEPNYLEQQGCKTFYLSEKKSLHIFNLPIIWKLWQILKRENVDILHCHRHKSTVYGVVATMLAGTPVVISHVHGISRTKNIKRKLTNFFAFKKISKIITVGEAVKQDVLQTNPSVQEDKVISVGNSIDCDRYANVSLTKSQAKEALNLPQDSFVFGTVARMAPNKGQIHLIKAFEKVKRRLPSAQLVFVGDGRLRSRLETEAAKAAPGAVHFLGHRSDIPEVLRAFDAYVHPSVGSEGLPRAILEAMAAGIPCIGCAAGGIPEIINTGDVGYLVSPKDEDALAEAMMKSAKISELERNRVIDNARQRVYTCYNHKLVMERITGIYEAEYNVVSR